MGLLTGGLAYLTYKEGKKHTPNQEALSDLAQESGRKGVSNEDADTLLEWGDEYNFLIEMIGEKIIGKKG